MKKLITFTLFLTTFSYVLSAKTAIKSPVSKNLIEISTLLPNANNTSLSIFAQNKVSMKKIDMLFQVCTTTAIPICSNGVPIAYITISACAANWAALLNLIESFHNCSGGGNQK